MIRFVVSAVVAGVVAGAGLAADLKSGPGPGDDVTPFNPLNVTGPDAGKKQCPV
ncbi:MAG TPA: hypothetical protein VKE40_07625 [Gemmataceae bacterium]|nr:hypothetical protein [Gemmataceae bacterium]